MNTRKNLEREYRLKDKRYCHIRECDRLYLPLTAEEKQSLKRMNFTAAEINQFIFEMKDTCPACIFKELSNIQIDYNHLSVDNFSHLRQKLCRSCDTWYDASQLDNDMPQLQVSFLEDIEKKEAFERHVEDRICIDCSLEKHVPIYKKRLDSAQKREERAAERKIQKAASREVVEAKREQKRKARAEEQKKQTEKSNRVREAELDRLRTELGLKRDCESISIESQPLPRKKSEISEEKGPQRVIRVFGPAEVERERQEEQEAAAAARKAERNAEVEKEFYARLAKEILRDRQGLRN